MIYLRQSTASQEIPLGYFVDSTDGNTEETALTIANTDIKLWKTGATTLANKNSGGGTHISNGIYYCTLDATDTNTLGSMCIFVHVSGALAERIWAVVLPPMVYDSLIAGSDVLQVDMTQYLGAASPTAATAGYPPVTLKVGTGTGEIDLVSGSVPIRTGFKRNTAISAFPFTMKDTNGAPLTGSTVTVYRAIDTATTFTLIGIATEKSAGWYHIPLSASDMNGTMIALRFAASGGSGVPTDNGVTLGTEP